MENKSIIDKIRKLLSLGNGTSFEGEADAALQKSYQLMQENNISMAQIQSASKDDALGYMGEENLLKYPSKKWERILMNSIARLFDCRALIQVEYIGNGRRQNVFRIIGREGNRVTAELTYRWIQHKIEHDGRFKVQGVSARNSYYLGCALSIAQRVSELKKGQNLTDEWGLVPMDEVDEWIKKYYPNLSSGRGTISIADGEAYRKGQSDGKDIGLNRQFAQHALPDAS